MDTRLSKSQIDKLGERLRAGAATEGDLRLLDAYRRTFIESYDHVIGVVQSKLGFEVAGRPAKSTTSIREKLNRESIRLTQMQDIAGCRVIVRDVGNQENAVNRIAAAFDSVSIVDRRLNPSHGYRAVHIVVELSGKPIEIQCRSELQHLWSQLSESLADVFDPALKYGGGPKKWRTLLNITSNLVAEIEKAEFDAPTLTDYTENIERRNRLKVVLHETIFIISNLKDD